MKSVKKVAILIIAGLIVFASAVFFVHTPACAAQPSLQSFDPVHGVFVMAAVCVMHRI